MSREEEFRKLWLETHGDNNDIMWDITSDWIVVTPYFDAWCCEYKHLSLLGWYVYKNYYFPFKFKDLPVVLGNYEQW